ncbi:MAG TPA: LamG domain-containing protein, partial [Armatimonadota bacterium]|nr:LamG domain-containing protein [Armatimonadota bacterium]
MNRLRLIAVIPLALLLAAAVSWAQDAERGPMAQWTFNGSYRKMILDVSGHEHHAPDPALTEWADAPGGQALVFNGRDTFLMVPSHPDLTMTDKLTVDVWLMVDDPDRAEPGCVIEKGGECYRIQIDDTTPAFGMKGPDHKFYLGGGSLTAGVWHRVTGVFDRPTARLYLDGELVREAECDHDMGPGANLCIGAKAGVTYMFAGKIDEIRIYDYPRPPRPDDVPLTTPIADAVAPAPEPKLEVRELPGAVSVDTGAARFELTEDGGVRAVEAQGKPVAAGNDTPLMAVSLFESDSYDGRVDCAPGRVIEGTWRCGSHEFTHDARAFAASWQGAVQFPGGDAINCTLGARIERGSPFMTLTAALSPSGSFTNRFLRSAQLRLPLALNKRKRVVQAGDRGVQWITRHWFQFHANSLEHLMSEPEHIIWRRFATDQNTPADYHIWRSESTATPALSMQRGLQAPGWMSVYDQRAGLLFAYRDFAQRAPKSLRVDADGAGQARVCLWHDGLPALDIRSPHAAAVFGKPHVTDWMA